MIAVQAGYKLGKEYLLRHHVEKMTFEEYRAIG